MNAILFCSTDVCLRMSTGILLVINIITLKSNNLLYFTLSVEIFEWVIMVLDI